MLRLGFLTHVNGHGDIRRTYAETLKLFVAADELGFDVGWVAQHHFDNDAGGLSAPWPFLAAAAARTKRIRLSTTTDVVQKPWAESYLDAWAREHAPRIGLSRLIFPAADRKAALAQLRDGALAGAAGFVRQGRFPARLSLEGYLDRFHAFHGHPGEVTAALRQERVLPLATDLLCQFNPGVPTHAAALEALELIATEIAPALGWKARPA